MSISMTIAEVSYWCEHSSLTSDQCSILGIDTMRELEYVTGSHTYSVGFSPTTKVFEGNL